MNGLELADWLRSREEGEHIPILLMSADAPPEARDKKHLRTLQKPFELETLLRLVAELLVSEAKVALVQIKSSSTTTVLNRIIWQAPHSHVLKDH
jgi:CheY-like chemotaxis protein